MENDKMRGFRLYCWTGGIGEERFAYRELCAMGLKLVENYVRQLRRQLGRKNLYKKGLDIGKIVA
jgi:hypothetical protein